MVVDKEKKKALVTYVQILAKAEARSRFIRLDGLDPYKKYRVGSAVYTGEILINAGIRIEAETGDFKSKMIVIEEVK
jgi:alpha-galactosidase